MMKLCRKCHSHTDKKDIDDFEKNYSSIRPIKWYTKESFLYRFVNRILRTEDLSDLFALRYYIADLSNDLKCCQEQQIESRF